MRNLVIGRDFIRTNDARGDETCGGFGVAVVKLRLVPADRLGETILVHGLEDAPETGVGRAPGGVRQVVALSVQSAVAVVVAQVQTFVRAAVRCATGETLDLGDLRWRKYSLVKM